MSHETTRATPGETAHRFHGLRGDGWCSWIGNAHGRHCDRLTHAIEERDERAEELRQVQVDGHAFTASELAASKAREATLREALERIAAQRCEVEHARMGRCAEAGLKSRCGSCIAHEAIAAPGPPPVMKGEP